MKQFAFRLRKFNSNFEILKSFTIFDIQSFYRQLLEHQQALAQKSLEVIEQKDEILHLKA